MLLQTNSYIVPRERRAEHARLIRRFRQALARIGCDQFEVYEQVGANWSPGGANGRDVQIIRYVTERSFDGYLWQAPVLERKARFIHQVMHGRLDTREIADIGDTALSFSEVKAIAIPAGVEVNLKLGAVGYITQALGGSFTVYIDGNLFRIAGQDADAIGKTAAKAPEVPPGASEEDIKNVVWQQLKTCYDPEIPVNIVDLGLIYECDVTKNPDDTRSVAIKMTLTAPGCGMGPMLAQDVQNRVLGLEGIDDVAVELVWDPPWNQAMMTEAAKLQLGLM